MNQTTMAALLGRPLSALETTNYSLYLKIALERLQDLTCLNLTTSTEDRTYDVREGYTTVFTDPFTQINSVEINGSSFTDYTPMQWNRRNASWYNSLVFETCEDTITINADWGLCSPELQLLTARLFGLLGKENKGGSNVKSKKIEDFSITFNDNTAYDQFMLDNKSLISKYSLCNISEVQHGEVRRYGYWGSFRGRPY